jgi:hypothetical protein
MPATLAREWDSKPRDRNKGKPMLSFHESLAKLRSPKCEPCRHGFSASFLDDDEYDRLEQWYNEAVSAFTASDGTPCAAPPLPGADVERVTCWQRNDKLLYAVLSYGDNTRVRILTIGLFRDASLLEELMRPDSAPSR